jgi:hypothetical protein
MKTSLLFLVLSITSIAPAIAQSGSDSPVEVLVVEFLIPEASLGAENVRKRYEVPKDFDFKSNVFIGGVSATTGCIECRLIAEYGMFIFKADRVTPDETVVRLAANFTQAKKCNVDRKVRIANNRKNTVKLKCGVTAEIYYDSQQKGMSNLAIPRS